MTALERGIREYARDASRLSRQPTTSELTYYPAIRSLLAAILRHLKKWLGYRAANRRGGLPMSLAEKDHFREIVQRIAAILSMSERLDQLYARAAFGAWTADQIGAE